MEYKDMDDGFKSVYWAWYNGQMRKYLPGWTIILSIIYIAGFVVLLRGLWSITHNEYVLLIGLFVMCAFYWSYASRLTPIVIHKVHGETMSKNINEWLEASNYPTFTPEQKRAIKMEFQTQIHRVPEGFYN